MKQILTVIFLAILTLAEAQSPNKISYQAVIRNSSNELVSNQSIGIQISILSGSPSGTVVYSEIHTKTTSASGLVSIEIGTGSSSDNFSSISWQEGLFYLKTETDPFGGTEYSITGTTQLLSVPYSFYANKAGSFDETDPLFDSSVAKGITEADTTNWNNNLSSYTETDPLFETSVSRGISEADTANWNNKLSSYTETDPLFDASVSKGITASDTTNWNNKLSSFTETDPLFDASVSKGISEADTIKWNNKLENEEQTLENVLSFGSSANSQIKDLLDPTDDQDAATKSYVDLLETRIEELETEVGVLNGTKLRDLDGNIYSTVNIGNQTWITENIKSTKDKDGNTIERYCRDDDTNCDTYGGLYSKEVAQIICPPGWHLPTDSDWKELESFLGMSEVDVNGSGYFRGNISSLLQTGGSSGLNIELAGYRFEQSSSGNILFLSKGTDSFFWTEQINSTSGLVRWFRNTESGIFRYNKVDTDVSQTGCRCVKDE